MLTVERFDSSNQTIPAYTGWLLSDIGEYKRMEELFKRQGFEVTISSSMVPLWV